MHMKARTADINPKSMEWALRSTGWNTGELAKEAKIEPDTLERWGRTGKSVRLTELERVCKKLRVPITVFFVESLPEIKLPKDYRRTRGSKTLSKDTLFAIKDSSHHQMLARRMLSLQGIKPGPGISPATPDDDPEHMADRERVGFNDDCDYSTAKKEREAYWTLRDRVEEDNIFVMQYKMDMGDARGFTLPSKDPAIIVINSADSYRSKMFTLLHEYAHILLNGDGICLPEEIADNAIEAWCNTFAGAFLMPRQSFESRFRSVAGDLAKPNLVLNRLSKMFAASKLAMAVRIAAILGEHDAKKYLDYCYGLPHAGISGGGLASPADKCVNRCGKRFAGMVLELGERRLITSADMIRYLGLKSKHFDDVSEKTRVRG